MNIVVLDGHTLNPGDLSWDRLKKIGQVTVYDRTPSALIEERARGAEIILTNKTPLRADLLAKLNGLRYIGVLATGFDVVDIQAAEQLGMTVTNIPQYGTDSVAQFVFALLLELCHHAGHHSDSVKRGEWSNHADFCYWHTPLTELAGKTMGIIGFGRIGTQTAQIAHAFGMHVVATSNRQDRPPNIERFRWVDQDELFAVSDVISLHCPLTPFTESMINAESLTKMKSSAFLINTSRGKLVHEQDLADALNNEVIAGAAVDVLSTEPPSLSNPLLAAKNIIITPHIAWASKEARKRLMETAIDNVQAYLNGKPINQVRVYH